MPRPSRCRRVCAEPLFRRFAPQAEEGACPNEAQPVVLAVDEYEVVRIVDLYKRSHEECARQMQVSRTTVTEIYDYLHLLWARVGTPHCPHCGKEIRRQTVDQIIDQILALPENTQIQ